MSATAPPRPAAQRTQPLDPDTAYQLARQLAATATTDTLRRTLHELRIKSRAIYDELQQRGKQ